jgi:DNA-binding response OmpR family regulator
MNRILIIEDVRELQKLLSMILASQNITFEIVSSKQDVDVLLKRLPQLIILDLDFGYMNGDGLQICREIKTSTSYRNIPVLVLSTDVDTLSEYKKLYNVQTLEKPFDLTTITGKIRSMLSKSHISLSPGSNSL